MMSSLKSIDLKCSETLRDSPPPPPSQAFHASGAFTSTGSSSITPSHQPLLAAAGLINPSYGQFITQQQAVPLFVKKHDLQRGADFGSNECGSTSSSARSILPTAIAASQSSLSFAIANAACSSQSSHLPPPQAHSVPQYFQHSPHGFPGFTLPSAGASGIWPLVHGAPTLPHHLPPSPAKQGALASTGSGVMLSTTKVQQNVAPATLPLALSPSKGSSGSSGARPLTLHVSTSRGPAVLQLQQSATSGSAVSNAKQPVKLLQAAPGATSTLLHSPSQHVMSVGAPSSRPLLSSVPLQSSSALGSAVPTRVPIIRPSPVHPVAAATAALLSQLASNSPTFGLVDPHNHHLQQQQLQAFLRSPLVNTCVGVGGAAAQHVVGMGQQNPTQGNALFDRSVIVSASGSQLPSGVGPYPSIAIGASPSFSSLGAMTSRNISGSGRSTPPTSTGTSATPSPTRPSILRKRAADISNGTNSSPSKRLGYESVSLARRTNDKGGAMSDFDTRSGTTIENPDAGNSNQSSSASTISASSAPESSNGNSVSSNQAAPTGVSSPSSRKRPRKQQLSELAASCGYGSDDETATPKMAYCERIEEETVMGPTGVGGIDGRYLALSHRLPGQGSLYLPTIPLEQALGSDLYGAQVDPQTKDTMAKSEYSIPYGLLVPQRSRPGERPVTSFDQLQQHIEQQRKHIPEYRPRPSLLSNYELSYDSKRYHFTVQDEVKARDEKRMSIADMSNQKEISQRICGWKIYLMSIQFDNIDRDERSNLEDLNEIHGLLNSWSYECDAKSGGADRNDEETDKEVDLLKEMVLANAQRVRVIRENIDDVKRQLLSLMKHKTNAEKLITKYSSKRPIRRKERGKNGTPFEQ